MARQVSWLNDMRKRACRGGMIDCMLACADTRMKDRVCIPSKTKQSKQKMRWSLNTHSPLSNDRLTGENARRYTVSAALARPLARCKLSDAAPQCLHAHFYALTRQVTCSELRAIFQGFLLPIYCGAVPPRKWQLYIQHTHTIHTHCLSQVAAATKHTQRDSKTKRMQSCRK
jgi:hypothetical protein